MKRIPLFRVSVGASLVTCLMLFAGCHTTAPSGTGTPCKVDGDCAAGTGVCRGGMCIGVPCTVSAMCSAGEACTGGMCTVSAPAICKSDSDCTTGTGVCRVGTCAPVACAEATPCSGTEMCVMGQCQAGSTPVTKGAPGHTLAAGGGVSTSGAHIHIGLTGQGRAVGPGASAEHKHLGGATAVLGR